MAQAITMIAQGKQVVMGTDAGRTHHFCGCWAERNLPPDTRKANPLGRVASYKVGSHHRLKHSDIEVLRQTRLGRQPKALEELRAQT